MRNSQNIPFSPAKFPFFYGWIILVAGTIGGICSIPGQTMGVSVFTDHLIRELGMSRDALSFAYMLGTAMSSFFLTYGGRIYDRKGARVTAVLAAVGLMLTLLLFSIANVIAEQISESFGVKMVLVAFPLVTLLFFLLRFTGQGMIALSSRNLIMKWFDRKRGLANGISSAAVSLGFSVSPLLLAAFIDNFQWDGAYRMLAAIVFLFVLFVFVFYRDNPEACGLVPDGSIASAKEKKSKAKDSKRQYTLKEAQRTWVFWIFALALSFNAFFITGFTFNVVSVFKAVGMGTDKALGIFLPASVISVAVAIVGSVISDYVKLQKLLLIFLFGCLLFTIGVSFLKYDFGYYVLILGNGLMGGLFSVLAAVTWPRFFGRQYLGEISGRAMALLVFGSAVAPLFFSRIFTLTGSYRLAGYIGAAMVLVLLLLSPKAKNPQI
ncbi:MAG: MFS transporter [Marinifilaceae bacterium]|jgi:sugar phosphate permease